jgi:MoxR-like ATPase
LSKNSEAVVQIKKIKEEIHNGIVGQESLVDGLILGLLADGHILIEGVPGLAKTRAVTFVIAAVSVVLP